MIKNLENFNRNQFLMVNEATYKNYINLHKSNKLDNNFKIQTPKIYRNKVFETFDKLYSNTLFTIIDYKFDSSFSNYNMKGFKIFFKTNSDNEYRIDLEPVKNYLEDIDSDFVWSISFTISDKNILDPSYEDITSLNETREVLHRIGDILSKIDIVKYFVIGNTLEEKRLTIYKNFILIVFPDYKIKMNYCEGFIDNKGLYIW